MKKCVSTAIKICVARADLILFSSDKEYKYCFNQLVLQSMVTQFTLNDIVCREAL